VSARFSFVVPVFNEQETLPELQARLAAVMDSLDGPCEAIVVDDGSSDGTYPMLLRIHGDDPRFKVVRLTRNFGHQVAITAGLDLASGEAVIIMDGDLQDPPEVAGELIARWQEGYEIVYGVRQDRSVESRWKRALGAAYYRVLRALTDIEIPVDTGDFRLVDRKALSAFQTLREQHRYVRGMFAWVGFSQIGVPYIREKRHAGETKYPLRKQLRLAGDGVVSFSNTPLRVALFAGFVVSCAAFVFGAVAIGLKLFGYQGLSPGWTSLVVIVSFLAGIQLLVLGTLGLYVASISDEVKRRPLYLVRDAYGFDSLPAVHPPRYETDRN